MKMRFSKKMIYVAIIFLTSVFMLVGCSNDDTENELINNPAIEDVEDAIASIQDITEIELVTEDNDPNGNLGKQGGYTGALFFLYALVEDNSDESPTSAGTDGGGCIEVYANEEDAQNRNSYLGNFDGTLFASGSHAVLGTLVIRTSNKLTASQQQTLELAIITALNQGSKTSDYYKRINTSSFSQGVTWKD